MLIKSVIVGNVLVLTLVFNLDSILVVFSIIVELIKLVFDSDAVLVVFSIRVELIKPVLVGDMSVVVFSIRVELINHVLDSVLPPTSAVLIKLVFIPATTNTLISVVVICFKIQSVPLFSNPVLQINSQSLTNANGPDGWWVHGAQMVLVMPLQFSLR